MSGVQQGLQAKKKLKEEDVEETTTESAEKATFSIKYTRLGSSTIDELDIVAGTTLQEVLNNKGAGSRGEVRVSRDGKSLQLDKSDALQEGDTVVWVPNAIRGGKFI